MLKNLSGAPGIKIILSKINAGAKNITVSSVYGSFRSVLYSLFVSKINKNVLIITSAETVYRLYGEMRALKPVFNMKKKITAYPEDDSFIYRNIKPSGKISAER